MSAHQPTPKGVYWIASYPKSGNTWLRLFLETYTQNPDTPLHINSLPNGALPYRRKLFDDALGLETADFPPDLLTELRPRVYDDLAHSGNFQFVKTHECFTYTASNEPVFSSKSAAGAVLIVRNPLDVAISMSHFLRMSIDATIDRMAGSHESHSETLTEIIPHRTGSWTSFANSWINGSLPLHIVRYEDMLDAPEESFSKILRFMNISLNASRLEKAIAFTRFDTLKAQESKDGFAPMHTGAKAFFRQGKKDVWQDTLSSAQQSALQSQNAELMNRFGYLS